MPPSEFEELLAHSVTATGGHVEAAPPEGTIECVELTFHYGLVGDLAMHSQRFMAVDALRPLLDQLQLIAHQLGV